MTFAEDNRTGYHPPEDKQFEEYTSASKAKTVKREKEPPKTNAEVSVEDVESEEVVNFSNLSLHQDSCAYRQTDKCREVK